MPVLHASTEPTNVSRALPPSAPVRDKPAASSGFSSLVDDNVAAKADPGRRRRDDTIPDAPRSRDTRAQDDRTPTDTDTPPGTDAPVPGNTDTKETSGKADKATIKADDSDKAAAPDLTAPVADASPFDPTLAPASANVTAEPVVVATPVQVAPQTPLPSQTPAPLAIAAAGLAAAKSATAKPADATGVTENPDTTKTSQVSGDGVAAPASDGNSKETGAAKLDSTEIKLPTGFAKAETKTDDATAPAPQALAHQAKADAKPDANPAEAKAVPASADSDKPKPREHTAASPSLTVDSTVTSPQITVPHTASHTANAPSPTVQLTAAVATAQPVPLNGLAVELAARATTGQTRFEIRLDPAELGRIDVRIDIDKQGNVTSHLTVEKPETLAMLRQDAPQLQRALHDAGFKTSDGGMQFSLGDQSQSQAQQQNDNSQRHAQRLFIQDDESAASAMPVRPYGRMSPARSGVDISV